MDQMSAAAVADISPTVNGNMTARGTSLQPGAGVSSSSSSVDNRKTTIVAEGAIQARGSDDRKVALEIVDAIAEEASL
jgi:hypothetical protein